MKKFLIVIILLNTNLVFAQASELLFKSGFSASTSIYSQESPFNYWTLQNRDAVTGYNWTDNIDAIPETRSTILGGLYGNYEGTWGTHVISEIAADPENADNKVMHYKAIDGAWNASGWYNSTRLSAAMMYNNSGTLFSEGYMKYRMRLKNFKSLSDVMSGGVDWLILSEMFQYSSSGCQIFRMNLSIHKDWGAGAPIYWDFLAQDAGVCNSGWSTVWGEKNYNVPDDDTWFTLEMYIKKGNASTGRVWVAITPDGGQRNVIFDVTNYTQDAVTEGYISDWALFKLYSDGGVVHSMANNGTPLEIYYDDFEYWNGFPDTISNDIPGTTPDDTPDTTPNDSPVTVPSTVLNLRTIYNGIPITSVRASSNDGNIPENTLDNDYNTRWSAEGNGEWIEFDLGSETNFNYALIAFYLGNQRSANFSIQVSSDRINWRDAFVGNSSITLEQQRFNFASGTKGRFVRYIGHGNTVNDWNSITEFDVY